MATLPPWPPASSQAPASKGPEWIFEDARSKALLGEIEQIAPSEASVLITGNTGTGKELIARYIHSRSPRRDGPFVTVTCGAFSESLVDAELFGWENGAFAGAFGAQAGWFEEADHGTIFLDEINDLPPLVQTKLLRVLQEREVVRLGGRKGNPIDVRVLASTTVELERLVASERFRKDLFYRLNIVSIDVQPLNERPGDIVPLARHFIDEYSRRLAYPRAVITPEAEDVLRHHVWEGNVRELENVIHRTLLMCDGGEITPANLRLPSRNVTPQKAPGSGAEANSEPDENSACSGLQLLGKALRQLCEEHAEGLHQVVEDALYREVFRFCHYSQTHTSRLLGVSRNVVRARLTRIGEIAPSRNPPGDGKDPLPKDTP